MVKMMDALTFCKKVGISNVMLHYLFKKKYLKKKFFANRLVFDKKDLKDFTEYKKEVKVIYKGKVGKYAKKKNKN